MTDLIQESGCLHQLLKNTLPVSPAIKQTKTIIKNPHVHNPLAQCFHIKVASSSNTKTGQISQESLRHSANNIGEKYSTN